MPAPERMEEEKLWLVRYIYKNDLADLPESGSVSPGHAVFRASNGEQVCEKLTAWLHLVLHEEASIESIELLPASALRAYPV